MVASGEMTDKELSLRQGSEVFPPSPPGTIDGESTASEASDTTDFPLPRPSRLSSLKVLDVDARTPDSHVARDPRLIRLTGVHPFNVEAPLTDLYNDGFLTSPELFYVRNHGAVPQVKDEDIPDWTFTVEGLVDNPLTITLRELLSDYEQKTYPITLVCAGNRRKEQNIVRKTKGFSWGAAGVSTALFTGVSIADVLRKAKPRRKARFVCMEGADKLPNGYYGTHTKLSWALDPHRGMMLAYKMNGEMLMPDHGKPLRVVIPGQIGGRSVKWLKKLIITAGPSDNWYHIYDNRVLPTMLSPEEAANRADVWKDERNAIYDLSTNSAVAHPAHDERVSLVASGPAYRVRGYAYGGGGRRVTRVEVSLDKGKTWRVADIEYAEDRYRDAPDQELFGGTLDVSWRESCFCWCFWDLDVALEELRGASDLLVRAMDESMNMQPRDLYWSVLGMMNNPWYRIVIHSEGESMRFEHPTQPALLPGGWMDRVKKAGGNLMNGHWGEALTGEENLETAEQSPAVEIKMTKDGTEKQITLEELRKHDGDKDPWFVVNGEVYDGTAFLGEHPGGAQSIISAAAMDSTEEFMAIHSETAKAMMPKYHIGTLDEASKRNISEGEVKADSAEPRPIFLDSRKWSTAILHAKEIVSWDTRVYTFKLDHDDQLLGLPTGQHLMMRVRDPVTREAILRSYTPVSETTNRGYLEILIKVYFATKEQKGGRMTQAVDSLPIGHGVDFKGPIGKFEYIGYGRCTINQAERTVKKLVMICGGSGITPIYQVLRAIMQNKADPTTCTVLDGNRLIEDILCKAELDRFASENLDKCKLLYTLTQGPEDWTGLRGRIAGPLLEEHVGAALPDKQTLVLVCGPPTMEKSVHLALNEMGWTDDDLLFF